MNVLKSFANKTLSYIFLASFALLANDAFGSTTTTRKVTGPSAESLVSMILALILVVLVILAIAWLAKKFNLTPVSSNHFKLVSSMSLGGRERIVIIEIQGQQHAIGVTNQSVNHLFKLDENITSTTSIPGDSQMLHKINKLFGYQAPNTKNKE